MRPGHLLATLLVGCLSLPAAPCIATEDSAQAKDTEPARQLEEKLRTATGRDRYELLVQLVDVYFDDQDFGKIPPPAEEALALQPASPDPALELKVLKALLYGYAYRRDLARALATGLRAETLARSAGSPADLAMVTRRLGDVYRYRGEYGPALARYAEAKSLCERLGLDGLLANVLTNTGIIYGEQANHDAALRSFIAARGAFERAGDAAGVALSMSNIAESYAQLSRFSEAQKFFEESIRRGTESIPESTRAIILEQFGIFWTQREEPRRALPYLQQALDLYTRTDRRGHLASAHLSLGDAWLALGDLRTAEARYESSLAIAQELATPLDQGLAWEGLARVHLAGGQTARSVAHLEQAVAIFRAHGFEDNLNTALSELATSAAALGRYREAFAALQEHARLQEKAWNAEKQRALAELQVRFEAQEKERKIALLTKDQALQAAQLRRREREQWELVAAFAALLAFLSILFALYRLKVRAARMHESLELERQVSARLREVDQIKDQFLANTSHELRTPLFGIIGLAESLRAGDCGDLPAPARGHLGMILGAAQRLEHLVGDVLDFSRIRAGRIELALRPVALRSAVKASLALVRPLAAGKALDLLDSVPDGLPEVSADAQRLEQILLNLLGNAIKFTPSGKVEVTARQEGDRVRVEVHDSGIGIAPEHQERIFRAFEQADGSTERSYGGTGLGLAVSRHLAELHGGSLEVQSAPGAGATFSFSLQVASGGVAAVAGAVAASPPPEPEPPTAEAAAAGAASILVVDDEPLIRLILKLQMAGAGFAVHEAADGLQALEHLDGIDLVLLDVMMPGMSGFEVCRRIRERYSRQRLPVIFVTAMSGAEDKAEGFAAGGNDFLAKPVAMEELLARVAAQLDLCGKGPRQISHASSSIASTNAKLV